MAEKQTVDPWVYTADEDEPFSIPLKSSADLDSLIKRIGDAHYVLLGEASHGTHEYYTWRVAITKRLIAEKGFHFIAVEGDWPDCYKVNRFIKNYPDSGTNSIDVLKEFNRWPTWMWANWEVVAFAEWLRNFNENLNAGEKVGFYGLDVYSLWESMEAIVNYLQKEDPEAAQLAKRAMKCFEPYKEEGQNYASAVYHMSESCRNEVVDLLQEIRKRSANYDHDPEAPLNAEQNAFITVNAENYYRSMVSFGHDSWNIRDTHMVETLNRLMKFRGPEAKVIVWEHNSHIGDARFTDMNRAGMVNVGQLVRQQHEGNDVVLVGFGSYSGNVIASASWGDPMQVMDVPPARAGSFEAIIHGERPENRLMIFNHKNPKERFGNVLPHRAIGVVYNPEDDKYGNYVPTQVSARYDAFIFLDQTKALHPLYLHPDSKQMPETYPFGV